MSEYSLINLLSLIIPLVASFHPKLEFYKRWKYWFPAMLITGVVFLVWDAWFTAAEVWSFNAQHVGSKKLIGMPYEEWAFFFCIPYACIFTFEAFRKMLPKFKIIKRLTSYITYVLLMLWVVGIALSIPKLYTMVCFGISIPVLVLVHYRFPDLLARFYPVFAVLLVPFIVVNGFLTGSFGSLKIVSYNDLYNLGFRVFQIPIEDFSYAFTMILMSLLFIRFFEDIFESSTA